MTETQQLIADLYSAFNARNVDACLAHMTDDVCWPKASEEGMVTGREEVRAYWTRQWAEFDPQVEPLEINESGNSVDVLVHQVVRTLDGQLLSDSKVTHTFTLVNGRIARMNIPGDGARAFHGN